MKEKRKRNSSECNVFYDVDQIREVLIDSNHKWLADKLDDGKEYIYVDKRITFADVITSGKGNYKSKDKNKKDFFTDEEIRKRAKKNALFYATVDDIFKYEKERKKDKVTFCETHQSSIHMPSELMTFLQIGKDSRESSKTSLNEGKYSTFIVNDCVTACFDKASTNKLLKYHGKDEIANEIRLDKGEYTNIDLHLSVHGFGFAELDSDFHGIRKNIFAKDRICVLAEKNDKDEFKIYILLYRNAKYYMVLKKPLPIYIYDKTEKRVEQGEIEESRAGQRQWRNALAELAMTTNIGNSYTVTCPFTDITVNFDKEGTLFRASHILAYSKCKKTDGSIDTDKAYDPDNGFLVTANVDALFDKYLITVNPDTYEVEKSKLVSEELVFDELKIKKRLEGDLISSKKVEYLKMHYKTFQAREKTVKS